MIMKKATNTSQDHKNMQNRCRDDVHNLCILCEAVALENKESGDKSDVVNSSNDTLSWQAASEARSEVLRMKI